jgi:hypothetical protein
LVAHGELALPELVSLEAQTPTVTASVVSKST